MQRQPLGVERESSRKGAQLPASVACQKGFKDNEEKEPDQDIFSITSFSSGCTLAIVCQGHVVSSAH